MNKLIHYIKYRTNEQYRTNYDNKVRFAQLMATCESILRQEA